MFGNLEIYGFNRLVYWIWFSKIVDLGSNVIYLEEVVDWKLGEEIVIVLILFEFYDIEIYKIGM